MDGPSERVMETSVRETTKTSVEGSAVQTSVVYHQEM